MSCALTTGYTLGCADAIGGIKSVRFIEWEYLDTTHTTPATITAASGVISVLTPRSSKKFYKYELPNMNKDFFNDDPQPNPENGTLFFAQKLQLSIRKLQATLRNEILLLLQNRVGVIVEDHNDKYWLLGQYNGLNFTASTAGTGTAKGEFNGYVLNLVGEEPYFAQEVSSGIIAALTN